MIEINGYQIREEKIIGWRIKPDEHDKIFVLLTDTGKEVEIARIDYIEYIEGGPIEEVEKKFEETKKELKDKLGKQEGYNEKSNGH